MVDVLFAKVVHTTLPDTVQFKCSLSLSTHHDKPSTDSHCNVSVMLLSLVDQLLSIFVVLSTDLCIVCAGIAIAVCRLHNGPERERINASREGNKKMDTL